MISNKLLTTENVTTSSLPGPVILEAGNMTTGYYGEVLASELMSGTALADAIGLTNRLDYYINSNWLKFSYDNKTLYIAKQPFFYAVSWRDIYLRGAVYGNSMTGTVPSGASPTVQNRTVEINGVSYRVRLMKGVNTDPYSTNTYNVDEAPDTKNSEWDRLILNMVNGTFGTLTPSNLGVNLSSNLGVSASYSSYCQERHPLGFQYRIVRGFTTVSKLGTADASNQLGWRPVLEPI